MTTTQCAHHWLIEAAAGPVSKGKCQLCGEEREFSNSTDSYSTWTTQPQRHTVAPQPKEEEEAEDEE